MALPGSCSRIWSKVSARGSRRCWRSTASATGAELKDQSLHLALGFSHPIVFPLPSGVSAAVERQTVITLECHDKQVLGQAAAELRSFRPPEPYKGKGIDIRARSS